MGILQKHAERETYLSSLMFVSKFSVNTTSERISSEAESGVTMTEDLWYHALKFLDKYRTDIQSHDVSDLYEFADSTGILERHKQLLSQPFKEGQVDMKIMY